MPSCTHPIILRYSILPCMARGEVLSAQQLLTQLTISSPEIESDLAEFEHRVDALFEPEDQLRIKKALAIMIQAHAKQTRIDGSSYAGHPLKVAICALTIAAQPNVDMVISALFHDIVEDQSAAYLTLHDAFPEFVADVQEEALDHMDPSYGEEVAGNVKSLTNPDFDQLVRRRGIGTNSIHFEDAKRAEYGEHVRHAIENPDVCILKLSDFMMNAGSLFNLNNGPRKTHFLLKYRPVVDYFITRIEDASYPVQLEDPEEILSYLHQLKDEMDDLMRDMKSA